MAYSPKLNDLMRAIPVTNEFNVRAFKRGTTQRAKVLADVYSSRTGFVGAFTRGGDVPSWSRNLADYHRDEFHAEGTAGKTKYSQIADTLPKFTIDTRAINCRHALEKWVKDGNRNVMPYSEQQDYGSCVVASLAALLTSILGWRAANSSLLKIAEEYIHPADWFVYSFRGYCGDGWDGWSCASMLRKYGTLLRRPYESGNSKIDLTDDDFDEQTFARTYCRSGAPQWMKDIAIASHPMEADGVFEFDGDTPADMMNILASGGGLHFGGTNTSGGSKPYTVGSVGPHEQTCYGADGSEEFRRFSQDVIGTKLADDDFAIINDQTWGEGFDGECADKYWPSFWGTKPQGAWVWKASQLLRYFKGDIMAYLPKLKGLPGVPVPPPGPIPNPPIAGRLYVESSTIIRGELSTDGGKYKYIVTPDDTQVGKYKIVDKPDL